MEKTMVIEGVTYYQWSTGAWKTRAETVPPMPQTRLEDYVREYHCNANLKPWGESQLNNKGVSMLSKKALNKLNGLKAGEANYIELSQPVSENREIKLDLAHILAGSSEFQGLKLGESALVKDVTLGTDSLNVSLSIGKVTKEETEAVRVALQKLVETKA